MPGSYNNMQAEFARRVAAEKETQEERNRLEAAMEVEAEEWFATHPDEGSCDDRRDAGSKP